MDDVKIKPCPFCGNINGLSVHMQLDSGTDETLINQYNVKILFPTRHVITTILCTCGCAFVTDSYRPIEAWNKRYYEKEKNEIN